MANEPEFPRLFYAGLGRLCHDVVKPPPVTMVKGGFDGIFDRLD